MKQKLFFAKTFGMIVFATVLTSCNKNFRVQELTEDKVINLGYRQTLPSGMQNRLFDVSIKGGEVATSMILDFGELFDDKITFPSGGFWTIYADSAVIITANRHKLKINYWKE